MRLINADELKERISIDSDLVEMYDGVMVPCIDFEYNIDEAPTVEAIPTKWINMWLLKNVFIWEATTMANETNRLQAIENIKYGFEKMLKDWEKENEVD